MESLILSRKELPMSCIELLAEQSRCKRGIPVARLFRYYFCEGNYKRCPLEEQIEESRTVLQSANLLMSKVEA
jgi:hypothetical protein